MSLGYRIQAGVNSLDHGVGAGLVRGFLVVAVAALIFGGYTYSQFRGLAEPEAMENAQLARRLATGRGFTTDCLRPVDLWYLATRSDGDRGALDAFPDLRHAPLFPMCLAAGFRAVGPAWETAPGTSVFAPERTVIVPLGWLLLAATGLLIFLLGRGLFDARTAVTAVVIYLVSDAVLADGVSGTPIPLGAFLVTAALYAAHLVSRRVRAGRSALSWAAPCLASGVLCGLAFLTGYRLVFLVPVVGLFLALELDRGRWVAVGAVVTVTVLVAMPWLLRNYRICGEWLGLAPYMALDGSALFDAGAFDRMLDPSINRMLAARALKLKLISHFGRLWEMDLRLLGSGLISCFFLVSFFHGFEREDVRRFRWCVALGLALLLVVGALSGGLGARWLSVFLPVVILFGTAFLMVLLDRVESAPPGWQMAVIVVVVSLTAVPVALKVVGPRAGPPYPPYYAPLTTYVCGLLEPDEMVCTDIPWATAWYGNRTSLLVPESVDDFLALREKTGTIGGLYLTTETLRRAHGRGASWLPVLNREIPPAFPLTHGIALPSGTTDQLFLMDGARWETDSEPAGPGEDPTPDA